MLVFALHHPPALNDYTRSLFHMCLSHLAIQINTTCYYHTLQLEQRNFVPRFGVFVPAASFSVRGLTSLEMRRYYNSQKYKTTTSCVMATKARASIKTVSFAIFGRRIEVEQWRKLGQTDPLSLEYSDIPPRHVVQVRKRLDINIKSNSVHQVSLCAILSFSRFSVKTPGTHISKKRPARRQHPYSYS